MLKPFPIPGSKLICSAAGSWLVAKNGKTAVKFAMDSGGQDEVFGPIVPAVCCHYQASMIKAFRGDIRGAISPKAEAVSLAGRKCAKYLFELPATGAGAPAGTYAVWLDDATGLPLKEELSGGIPGAGGTTSVTYADLQGFGKGSFSPAKSEETDSQEDVHCEPTVKPGQLASKDARCFVQRPAPVPSRRVGDAMRGLHAFCVGFTPARPGFV